MIIYTSYSRGAGQAQVNSYLHPGFLLAVGKGGPPDQGPEGLAPSVIRLKTGKIRA